MDTSLPFIHLDDLLLRTGECSHLTYALELPPVILGGVEYSVLVPDGVTIAVDRVTGGFLVHTSLTASIYGPCERCLREVALQVEADEEEFVPTAKDGWDKSEFSEFIQDMVVDVKSLAREALVLAFPTQILCSPSCLGLCAHCGHDLNLGPCSCDPVEMDDRWSRLKEIDLTEEPSGSEPT